MKKTDLYLKPGTYIKSSTTSGEVQGISLENFVVSVLNNPTCCPKPPGSPDGMLMTALPLNLTLQTVTDFVGNNSAIQLSTLRLGIRSDSSVTTQVSSVIQATTTNSNLVIAPNGTGALIANIPDGTATGGNARGIDAVDLQMSRTLNTQVAGRDYSVIAGGQNNLVGGVASAKWSGILAGRGNSVLGNFDGIIAGDANTTNLSGSYNVIGGGLSNAVSGSAAYSGVFSGSSNIASSNHSVVSGGQSNTASTNTHATVVGGSSNTSSGQNSVSGGLSNTASGLRSVSFGESNTNSASYSFGIGYRTTGYLYGQFQAGSGFFTANSDAQQSLLTARREAILTTGGTAVLSLDGTGVTNLIIPTGTNRMWNVTIKYVAVVTTITGTATGVTVGDTKSQNIEIGFKKLGGVSSLVGGGSFSIPQEDASMGSASLIPTAGASQELALTFTAPTFAGGGSVTCRVVAKVELVEVAY